MYHTVYEKQKVLFYIVIMLFFCVVDVKEQNIIVHNSIRIKRIVNITFQHITL